MRALSGRRGFAVCLLAGACVEDRPDLAAKASLLSNASPFGEVVASGTGCSEGTWEATAADDGASLIVKLSDFADVVGRGRPRAAKSCSLSIRLREDDDERSFAPSHVVVSGRGGPVQYTTRVSWAGSDQASVVSRGPHTGMLRTAMYAGDLRSSCGGARELVVALDAVAGDDGAAQSDTSLRGYYFDEVRIELSGRSCPRRSDAGAARPTPEGDDFWIESVRGANDCASGAVRVALAPDRRSFTAFADVSALAPSSLACFLLADVVVAEGKTFALSSVVVRGESTLPADHQTQLTIVPGFVAQSGPEPQRKVLLRGPHEGAFALHETFAGQELNFRDCVTRLPLRLGVMMRSAMNQLDASDSVAAVPSAMATLTQVGPVSFTVRDCPSKRP